MARRRPTKSVQPKRAPRDLRDALRAAGPIPSYAGTFTTEQAADVARQRVLWLARRAQIAESHRRRSRLSDPDLVQARHSPTVEIAVDDPEAKKRARRNITRVRQSEAWRHNNLDAMQRQAETEMLTAWTARTMGLSAQGLRLDRIGVSVGAGGSVALFDHFAHLEQTWVDWVVEAKAKRIRRSVVIEILSEPRTLVEIERAHRLRRGTAIEIYRRALDLWAKLRGWLRCGAT